MELRKDTVYAAHYRTRLVLDPWTIQSRQTKWYFKSRSGLKCPNGRIDPMDFCEGIASRVIR